MQLSRTKYEELMVDISEPEKDEKRKEVLKILKEKEDLEFRLKQAKDLLGGDIKDKGNKITEIRKAIENGKEMKRIAVETVRDITEMRYIVRRLDTGEILENRQLNSDEYPKLPEQEQIALPLDASCTEKVYGPEDEPEQIEAEITKLIFDRSELVKAITAGDKGQPSFESQNTLRTLEREIETNYTKLLEAQRRKEDAAKKASAATEAPQEVKEAPADGVKKVEVEGNVLSVPGEKDEASFPALFEGMIKHFKSAARLAGEIDVRLKAEKEEPLGLAARTYQRYAKGERTPDLATVNKIIAVMPSEAIQGLKFKPIASASPQDASTSPAKKGK